MALLNYFLQVLEQVERFINTPLAFTKLAVIVTAKVVI